MPEQTTMRFKVLMLGDGRVGKTTFKNRFLTGKFTSGYTATIGADFASHKMTFNGNSVIMSIWDLAGQINQSMIRKTFYTGAHGALVLYDITNENSFKNIEIIWLNEIIESLSTKIPFLLIANKIDQKDRGIINTAQGHELLRLINDGGWVVEYLETSALQGTNVNEAFTKLIQLMLDFYQKQYPNKNVS